MTKKTVIQTVTASAVSVVTLSGRILENTDAAVTIRVRRPRTSRYNIVTVPKDKNFVAVYGQAGAETDGQVVVRKLDALYSATGVVSIAKDGGIVVQAEGDYPTTFYAAEGVSLDIVGEDASEEKAE